MYVKRMGQVTFGNNLSIDVEKNSPFLTVRASSYYVDGDVHDLDLNLHPSALLHGGIPTCFQWKKRMLVICLRGHPTYGLRLEDFYFSHAFRQWASFSFRLQRYKDSAIITNKLGKNCETDQSTSQHNNITTMSQKLTLLCAKVERIGDICKERKEKMVLPT